VSALVIDRIGLLVTNDPTLGEGPLGIIRDAALVFEDGRVAAVERAGAAGDEHVDAGGRCVIPGFVDSHTHLDACRAPDEELVAEATAAGVDRLAIDGHRCPSASVRSRFIEPITRPTPIAVVCPVPYAERPSGR